MSSRREDEESTFECVSCGHVWKAKGSQPCPLCRNPVAVVWDETGAVGWGRSFFLALLSLIVGFLFASVWLILYVFTEYQLLIHFGAPFDWGWLIPDAILSVVSPFFSFHYVPNAGANQLPFSIDFPISSLIGLFFGQSFDIVWATAILARFVISFLVYASFFVPIIKFCLSETKRSVSWMKAFILGIKSAVVGFILSALFFLLGGLFVVAAILGLTSGSTSSLQPPPTDLSMIVALVFLVLAVVTIFSVLVYTATGATIIRYTTREASRVRKGSSWGRSFLISLKANIVAMLWDLLFCLLFGIFAVAAIAGSIQGRSIYSLGEGIIAVLIFLIIVIILSELSPTASIIKYLVEEIDKNLEREKAELKVEKKPEELSKDIQKPATDTVKVSVEKRSLKGKIAVIVLTTSRLNVQEAIHMMPPHGECKNRVSHLNKKMQNLLNIFASFASERIAQQSR